MKTALYKPASIFTFYIIPMGVQVINPLIPIQPVNWAKTYMEPSELIHYWLTNRGGNEPSLKNLDSALERFMGGGQCFPCIWLNQN